MLQAKIASAGRFAIRLIVKEIKPACSCPFCYHAQSVGTVFNTFPNDQCECPHCHLVSNESAWQPAAVLRCRKLKKCVQRPATNGRGGAFRVKIKLV